MLELQIIECKGSPREIGRAHGEGAREKIRGVIEGFLTTLIGKYGGRKEDYLSRTADYLPWIGKYPHLIEEIEGVGEGAGISSEEALLMQSRGEFLFSGLPECTGFAASGDFTKDGAPIAGQNFDLEPVDDFVVLLKIRPDKGPSMLILTVAGGIGYGGLNSDGLAVDLNMVSSAGWRVGMPSYLTTRLALEQPTAQKAADLVLGMHRASSRNYLFTDESGDIIDVETTVDDAAVLRPGDESFFVHTNHYLDPALALKDTRPETWVDSPIRLKRMQEQMRGAKGTFTVESAKQFLKDHTNAPLCICRHVYDEAPEPVKTVGAVISSPRERSMLALAGNPCQEKWIKVDL